jgi:hypothetical protein
MLDLAMKHGAEVETDTTVARLERWRAVGSSPQSPRAGAGSRPRRASPRSTPTSARAGSQ